MITEESTIAEARQYLRENADKGAQCPCCTQMVKLYKRTINSAMAVDLIRLNYLSRGYHHKKDFGYNINSGGGDFAKLVYWELVEAKTNEDEDKKDSGMWRITDKGNEFVRGLIKVPKYAKVYNAKCIGFTGEQWSIRDALGEKFSYRKLMDAPYDI